MKHEFTYEKDLDYIKNIEYYIVKYNGLMYGVIPVKSISENFIETLIFMLNDVTKMVLKKEKENND